MPAPVTRDEFLDLVRRSGVLEAERLDTFLRAAGMAGATLEQPQALAARMVRDGLLTKFQASQLLMGKWRRFLISDKYKLLELLGAGGMGAVYLCEHIFMRRLVALKVLPIDKIDDQSAIERFYREARAAGALDHPNIVRAYDIDKDDKIYFLVMEYVDGANLQDVVARSGPMDPTQAAHYVRQAALGLQHAHEAGLVHRDIKPGNLLLERSGTIKILDLGLARFFNAPHKDNVTEKYDEKSVVLGTADYLAPEQAIGSAVDIRADIYSLGGTFYYLLSGKAPFENGTITQKLLWHQTRQPESLRAVRPEAPEALAALIERMMAKIPDERFQTPQEVADALATWTEGPIPPPSAEQMPQRDPATLSAGARSGPVLPTTPPRVKPSAVLARGQESTATRAARTAVPTQRPSPAPAPLPRANGTAPQSNPLRKTKAVISPAAKPTRLKQPAATEDALTPRNILLAAAGGAAAVVVVGGALWWALSGTKDRHSNARPEPVRQASPSVAKTSPTPALPSGEVIPAEKAAQHMNQRCTVEMVVRRTGKDARAERYFLNSKVDYRSSDNFTVTFTKTVADQLRAKGIDDVQNYYQDKTVRVTGTVTEYSGRPEIAVDDASQIEVVETKP
jgi:serine/threonine protein kinase